MTYACRHSWRERWRGGKAKFDAAKLEACQADIADCCELSFEVTVLIDTREDLQGASEDDIPGDVKAELRSMTKEVENCFRKELKGNDELLTSCADGPETAETVPVK